MASAQLDFIRRAAPGAQRGYKDFGVPASVTIAQAILESGWGKSHIGSANNYFGIKAHMIGGRVEKGPIATGFVVRPTKEVVGGKVVTVNARFRAYASMAASMRDHGHFLRHNSRYEPAFAFKHEPNEFARALQRAGYATDPQYAAKLIDLMRTWDLYRFDKGVRPGKPKPQPKPEKKPRPKPKPAPSEAEARARSYLAGLQRDLNTHLQRLGSPQRLALDGRWDAHTALAFRQVCKVIGIEPERSVRTFRVIAGATALRSEAEKARAAADGLAFAEQLKQHFERTRGVGEKVVGGKSLPERERMAAFVAALQRDLNTQLLRLGSPRVLAVDGAWDPHTDRAFRQVAGMLGIEPKRCVRTFRLIAGAGETRTKEELDRAAKAGAELERRLRDDFAAARTHGALNVVGGKPLADKERAQAFLAGLQRDLNTQLKWLGATKLLRVDGMWDAQTARAFERVCKVVGVEPVRSVRTFRVIAGATAARSQEELDRAVLVGAPYAEQLRASFAVDPPPIVVTRPGKRPRPSTNGGPPKTGRIFRVRSPELKGADVEAFQRVLNQRYERWGVNKRIDDDGEYGTLTRDAARQVAFGLGITAKAYAHGVGPELREKIRKPGLRTPAELERAQRRRDWLRRLRRRHDGGGAELAIEFARKHVGLRETSRNRHPLVDKWNRAAGSPIGSEWCGNFMNACLMAAGFPSQPFLAICKEIERLSRAGHNGWRWITANPRPGDLVLYTIDGAANHVGLLERVEPTQLVTIEGNTRRDGEPSSAPSGGLYRRHRPITMPRGYARPPYSR
jgi:tellurite resistance protein